MTVLSGLRQAALALGLTVAAGLSAGAQTTLKPLDNAADPLVATVDGAMIRRSDVQDFQRNLPPQYQQLPLEMLFPTLLDRLIDSKLIYEAGVKQKLEADEEVKRRLQQYEERLVQEIYLTRLIEKTVTPDALRQRYEKFIKETPAREEISARHILVQTEAEAKDVLAQIQKGADFAELARSKSIDPSAKAQGGDLGFFGREEMVPEFSEAAFKLKDGEITKAPVKTQFGWHIIKVEARRTAARSFEDVREKLTNDMSQETMNDLVGKLRKDAKIERFNVDGSKAGAAAPATPARPRRP
jgi:peptidyl-prolyl cis-trans isomerase C